MKKLALMLLLVSPVPALAHDEGHGPKLTDAAKQGGVISPVIDAKEHDLGAKAAVVYKAELVRSEDGSVKVYLYDKDMKALDLKGFDAKAKGVLEEEKKGKITKKPFSLALKDGVFSGKPPKPTRKPFNIDVTYTQGKRKLLSAFDNLD
ncbi:MAG: hypothetical protein HY078_13475 [Elusimicrobia bacterium]|nr:hypothetical protein [Elusimicrobiota bacterium]